MSIPLVQENSVDAINTSLIAIRNQMGNGGSNMSDVNVNVDVNYNVADTVERGNSLPVTSNGVANCLSYSTQEKFTGKYWIDGKDIWSKTVHCGALPNNSSISIQDVIPTNANLTKIEGIARSSSSVINLPYTDYYQNQILVIGMSIDVYSLAFRTNFDASSYQGDITLEYTKTT